MSAEKNAAVDFFSHCLDFILKPFAVAISVSRSWWAEGALLAEWQVVADCRETRFRQGICQGHQQGRVDVTTCTVCEHESIGSRFRGPMQKSCGAGLGLRV